MKYYICIEEPKLTATKEDVNLFVNEVFGRNSNRYFDFHNYGGADFYNYCSFAEKTAQCKLTKGIIYHTTLYSDDHILDDYGNAHKIMEFESCLKEYSFEIDEATKRIIKNKEEKGDTIFIEPLSYNFKEEKAVYCVTVTLNCKKGIEHRTSRTTVGYSISDSIMYCYSYFRGCTKTVALITKCLDGKAYKKKG